MELATSKKHPAAIQISKYLFASGRILSRYMIHFTRHFHIHRCTKALPYNPREYQHIFAPDQRHITRARYGFPAGKNPLRRVPNASELSSSDVNTFFFLERKLEYAGSEWRESTAKRGLPTISGAGADEPKTGAEAATVARCEPASAETHELSRSLSRPFSPAGTT